MIGRAGFFVEIIWAALDRVGSGAGATANYVSDVAMLIALVVVHMPRNLDDARLHRLLFFFQEASKMVLLRTRSVTRLVVGAGVRRMVQQNEDEVGSGWNIVELIFHPQHLGAT